MSIVKSFSVGNGDMFYINHNTDNFTTIDCCLSDEVKDDILEEIASESLENPRARDPLSRSRLDPRGRGKRVKESRYKNDPCQKGSWQGIFL